MNATAEARFWAKVERRGPDECWPWTGARTGHGYGNFWDGERYVSAHLFVLSLCDEAPASGEEADHGCRVRHCVNPLHLEIVTHRENQRRGLKGELTTHCPQGHPYDAENTRWRSRNRRDKRECRACDRIRHRAARAVPRRYP